MTAFMLSVTDWNRSLMFDLCLSRMPKSKEVLSSTSGSDSDSEVETKVCVLPITSHSQTLCMNGWMCLGIRNEALRADVIVRHWRYELLDMHTLGWESSKSRNYWKKLKMNCSSLFLFITFSSNFLILSVIYCFTLCILTHGLYTR